MGNTLVIKFYKNGFSLIEIVIGVALFLIIALGVYGAFRLSVKVVHQSKARITAIMLANERIEEVRNLPYNDIGTVGGIPSGDIPQTENVVKNGVVFTVKTTISYVDDPFDGTAPDDSVPNDYKRVKVKVFWSGLFEGEVVSITDVAPKGLESTVGGGNLLVSVFDALGNPISQADIHIANNNVDPQIDVVYQSNDNGQYLVAGAPTSTESYEITVSKSGYSTDRTYGKDEVVNPLNPHATVLEGQLTQISFSIDKLSKFSIDTLSCWGSDDFSDSFLDTSKVSYFDDVDVGEGRVVLSTSTIGYVSTGNLISKEINPDSLIKWDKFTFSDEEPSGTKITYQLYYSTNTLWSLIPDFDLPGNSVGFESSPVDISNLSTSTYYKLKVKGNLSTDNSSTTPVLCNWQVSWKNNIPVPIPNVSFHIRGNKIIGTDINDDPCYKYSATSTTDSNGHIDISDLEWDKYTFTIKEEDLDLVSTDPISDPVGEDIELLPDTTLDVKLYLEAQNSLLVTVKDGENLKGIFNAQVKLYNLSYDKTQLTNEDGQVMFIPLDTGTYNLEIQAEGYQSYSGTVDISKDQTIAINLTPIES
ncbi:carboxypeptidase regulatory-like domain-containing protein [bacterium]|nr:carboxypeptidase regulatory-like domain-containing protein [bacterium]